MPSSHNIIIMHITIIMMMIMPVYTHYFHGLYVIPIVP